MSNKFNPKTDPDQTTVYQIRVEGHLGRQWTDWFGGLTITLEDNGYMLLTGPVVDQAALHGLLKKVRDLGMPLLSVNRVKPGQQMRQRSNSKLKQSYLKICQYFKISYVKSNQTWRKYMKAIIFTEYGSPDVLQLKDVEKPAPHDNEVLIKIHAASANPADWHTMRAEPFLARLANGLLKSKNPRLGADLAGHVEAIGRNVTQFQVGDDVFGGLPLNELGSFAEYVCANEDILTLKPAGMTFEQAAAVPLAAFTALQGLRDKGQIRSGQKVLINGASGGVGTFAVQIAKSFGTEVTGVCSTRNLDLVRSIGADHVIDYTREDFTQNGQHYDLIFDAVGNRSVSEYQRALSPNGICAVAGFTSLTRLFQFMFFGGKQVGLMETAKGNKKDLMMIKELLEAGKVIPVIDKTYLLSQVSEAIRYLETGHARGKVVITVEQNHK
jgi:NADPH:quinone reductase-like Zn-dependent oxidoreductase